MCIVTLTEYCEPQNVIDSLGNSFAKKNNSNRNGVELYLYGLTNLKSSEIW